MHFQDGKKSPITYEVWMDDGTFGINDDGVIFVNATVDHEVRSLYNFRVSHYQTCLYNFIIKVTFNPILINMPASAMSWFAFVVNNFLAHENCDNRGQLREIVCKECWLQGTFKRKQTAV